MKKRKYKKIMKLLNKSFNLLAEEKVDFKRESYGNAKIKILRAIDELNRNKLYWIDK